MPITPDSALSALAKVDDPETSRPLTEGMVKNLAVDGEEVSLTIEIATPFKERTEAAVRAALEGAGAKGVRVTWKLEIPTRNILPDDPCPGVRNILLGRRRRTGRNSCR
jgi:ATP-binding protein involved in chromosome partitioning